MFKGIIESFVKSWLKSTGLPKAIHWICVQSKGTGPGEALYAKLSPILAEAVANE